MSDLKEVLSRIGMTEDELKIYNVVVAFGFRTAGQISSYVNIDPITVKEVCGGLISKNYLKSVKHITEESETYIALSPKISISNDVSNRLSERLKSLSDNVNELWTGTQSIIDKDSSNLTGLVDGILTQYSDKLNSSSSEIQAAITNWSSDVKNKINEVNEKSYTNFQENVTNPLAEFTTRLDALSTSVLNIAKISVDAIESKNKAHQANIEKSRMEIIEELSKFADGLKTQVNEFSSALVEKTTGFKDNRLNESTELINQLQTSIENMITSEENKIAEINKDLDTLYNTQYTKFKTNLEKELKQIIGSLDKIVDKSKEITSKAQSNAISSSEQIVDAFHDKNLEKITLLRDGFLSSTQSVQLDAVAELNKLLDSTSTDLKQLENNIVDNLMGHQSGLDTDLKKLTGDLTSSLKGDFQTLETNLGEFIANIKNSTKTNIDNSVSSVLAIKTEMDTKLDEFQLSIEELLKNTIAEIKNESISKIKQDNENSVDKFVRKFDSFNEQMKSDFERFYDSFHDSLSVLRENVPEEIDTTFVDQIDRMTQFQTDFERISRFTDGMLGKMEELLEPNSKIKLKKVREELYQELLRNRDDYRGLNSTINEHFTSTTSGLDVVKNDLLEEVNKTIQDELSKLESMLNTQSDTLSKITKEFTQTIDTNKNNLNDEIIRGVENLDTKIEASMIDSKATVNALKSEVGTTLNTNTTTLQKVTEEQIDQLEASFTEFKTKFNSILNDATKNISETVTVAMKDQNKSMKSTISSLNKLTTKTVNGIESTQSSLDEQVGKPLQAIEKEVEALTADFETHTNTVRDGLVKKIGSYYKETITHISNLDKIKTSFSTSMNKFEKGMGKLGTDIHKDIEKSFENDRKTRSGSLEQFNSELKESVISLDNSMKSYINESQEEIDAEIANLSEQVTSAYQDTIDLIEPKVTDTLDNSKTSITGTADQVVNTLINERVTISGEITNLSKHIKEIISERQSAFGDQKGLYTDALSNSINAEDEQWKQKVNDTYEALIKQLSTMSDEFKSKVISASEEGKSNVTDTFNSIPSIIEETLDAAAKSMQLLTEISKGSIALEPKFPELSYFDASKEAIAANLNGVLSRTKSSATIIAPTLEWLDLSLLDKFTRVNIKIVTDLSKHTPADDKVVQAFKDKNIQLSLRRLDKNRYRGEIDMILVTRDKEEVMLSKLLSDSTPYGFVSQDEVFVEKLGILFTDFMTMPKVE